jgi:hypothetical protein
MMVFFPSSDRIPAKIDKQLNSECIFRSWYWPSGSFQVAASAPKLRRPTLPEVLIFTSIIIDIIDR